EQGEFIHGPGEKSDQLFIVHRGKVKVYRLSETGREQLLRILDPGDFAGELSLFSSTEQDGYAGVMLPSELCTIHRADMQEVLLKYPDISLHVLAELSRRLSTSEKQTAVIATASVTSRLAQYLADQVEERNSNEFSLPMSRRNLASFLGTTPETVSRKLGDFESAGWIKQTGQRKITILDLDSLLLVD